MKQILQNISNGKTDLIEVPCPKNKSGNVLIETRKTIISKGTEKMLIDFGKSSLLGKAISQPDKVKQTLEKIKNDGLSATYDAVTSKLEQPVPLGYCNVGKIIDSSNTNFAIGTRVVSNGFHAEIVRCPKNLVVPIPDKVNDETASFVVLSSIALQGIRLINPSIGEKVIVFGLGLIGLLAVQILKANGLKVLGIDIDPDKCALAKKFGAEIIDLSSVKNPVSTAKEMMDGKEADAVLITASSTSNEIIHQAAQMTRKRGKIVLIGVVGLNISRDDFYEKEISFQVSCSYGPGRYDKSYEEEGHDYPYPFVRWTEKRNFEAVLSLMEEDKIYVEDLISKQFDLHEFREAYEELNNSNSLGIILNFPSDNIDKKKVRSIHISQKENVSESNLKVSFIGAGNYASRTLLPLFKKHKSLPETIVTSSGIGSTFHGIKNNFKTASTDINFALDDESSSVVIATRHNQHAEQVIKSIKSDKNVYVEKPLCITLEDVHKIEETMLKSNKILMVGYNRRFAPLIKKMKSLLLLKKHPKSFIFTMCPGSIDNDSWVQDINEGGGRLIGEACHYIDLMRFLVGEPIIDYSVRKLKEFDDNISLEDKFIISLAFKDGSIGSINYFANGGTSFPKERIEVFCDDSALRLDNFMKLEGFSWDNFNKQRVFRQDKGQSNCIKEFLDSVNDNRDSPIPLQEILEVSKITIEIANKLRGT
tara:strand:- start:1829 stop:3943 length:2115 start_codon:yes stop_codon:yes gene_type:complete